MKKLLFSLTALVCSTALFAQTAPAKAAPVTATPATTTTAPTTPKKTAAEVAKFESESIDLGKVKQDNPATATFTVTNISKEPLIIEQANPTCGCTISDYTKEPIAPGKTGTIKATYNAKNLNAFEKHLTVKFAGVDEVKSITIKGEVLNADDYAKAHPGAATDAAAMKATPVAPATTTADTKTTTTTTKTTGKKTTSKKTAATKVATPAAATTTAAPKS